jgi:hypothetical protein
VQVHRFSSRMCDAVAGLRTLPDAPPH